MNNKDCKSCNDNLIIDCGCKKSFPAKCVIYQGEDFKEYGITKGDNVEGILETILNLIKTYLDEASVLGADNIGEGVKVYKRKNSNKILEFRTLLTDDSIDIDENQEELVFKVNKEWLDNNTSDTLSLSSPKNTILIENEDELDINPNYFKSEDDDLLEIIEENNSLLFKIKTDNLNKSVGTGEDIFIGISDNKNAFRTIKAESNTMDLSIGLDEENGLVIRAENFSEDPNMKYFYVNVNYEGSVEDGSIGRPYKSLENAINAFIGDTNIYDRVNPEFYGRGKIILLSNVFVNVPLTLNGAVYDLGGNVLYYNGSSKMIDCEYLVDNSPKDTDGKLLNNVFMNILNGTIDNRYNGNVIHIKHYHNGTTDNQNTVKVTLNNLKIIDNSHIGRESDFTKVTDFSGQDVIVYSSNIYYSTLPLGEPLILIENVNYTNEGSVNINSCDFSSGLRVPFECKNTTLNMYNCNIGNSYSRFLVNSVNSDVSGYRFNAKTGLNMINNTNSYLALWNCNSELGANPAILGKRINVFDKAFKLKTDSVNKGNMMISREASLVIDDFLLNSQVFNNLISFEGNVTLSTKDANFDTTYSLDNAVKRESGTNILTMSLNNGFIRNVTNTSPVIIQASSAIVNGFEYTSNSGFPNDSVAKDNGLIVGNIYYNTTTNSFTRIFS